MLWGIKISDFKKLKQIQYKISGTGHIFYAIKYHIRKVELNSIINSAIINSTTLQIQKNKLTMLHIPVRTNILCNIKSNICMDVGIVKINKYNTCKPRGNTTPIQIWQSDINVINPERNTTVGKIVRSK